MSRKLKTVLTISIIAFVMVFYAVKTKNILAAICFFFSCTLFYFFSLAYSYFNYDFNNVLFVPMYTVTVFIVAMNKISFPIFLLIFQSLVILIGPIQANNMRCEEDAERKELYFSKFKKYRSWKKIKKHMIQDHFNLFSEKIQDKIVEVLESL